MKRYCQALAFALVLGSTVWAGAPHLDVKLDLPQQPALVEVDGPGQRAVLAFGIGQAAGSVQLIERRTGNTLWSIAAMRLRNCYFCDRGRLLFVSTPEGWTLWDTLAFKQQAQVRVDNQAAGARSDGNQIVVSQGNTIKVYDGQGKLMDTFPASAERYVRLMVNADGSHIALGNDSSYGVFKMSDHTYFSENSGRVALPPDGKSMLRKSPGGWMMGLSLESGAGLTRPVQANVVGDVVFSSDGELILTQGADEAGHHRAQVWRFPGLELVGSRRQSFKSRNAFTTDGKSVISWEPAGETLIWNPSTGVTSVTPIQLPEGLRWVVGGNGWLSGVGGSGERGYYCSYSW